MVQTFEDSGNNSGLVNMARQAIREWGVLGTTARYMLIRADISNFLNSQTKFGTKSDRSELLKRFAAIHKNIHCTHSPSQFILMAQYLLNLEVEGPIIECGCYKGGSSAKLSHVAKILGKELIICDSFQGLPAPENQEEATLQGQEREAFKFEKGEYCGTLEEVKRNIETYGCIDVCRFVEGFYSDSLPTLDVAPSFVFIDVDLVSSARDCLKNLWPKTKEDGLWFTHEAGFPEYIEGIFSNAWWQETLAESPPIPFGAGSGMSATAPSIAYFKK